MISKLELNRIAQYSGLTLYQQEKDYFLKLFLSLYYHTYDLAVFKGGTCLKYIFDLDRFSEDLDFNVPHPRQFQKEVRGIIRAFAALGIDVYFRKEELFKDAYTCEVGCKGPLYQGTAQTENKFRIDAGYRTGTLKQPEWKIMQSLYPETKQQFLVKVMHEEELYVEKILALLNRNKGRDLYDVWFLLQAKVHFNKNLFEKKRRKGKITLKSISLPSKDVYERDMLRLTKNVPSYEVVKKEIKVLLSSITLKQN